MTENAIDNSNPVKELEVQNPDTKIEAYIPTSDVCETAETVAPIRMLYEMTRNLENIEREVKGIDFFVMQKLGYENFLDFCNSFNAEQVDAIASAIVQIEKGQAIIIADATGLGKGRIAAGILRYAKMQGKKPMFITEKANLFSDIYRDIIAIGLDAGIPIQFETHREEKIISVNDSFIIAQIKTDIKEGNFELSGIDEERLNFKKIDAYTQRAIEAYRDEFYPDDIVVKPRYQKNDDYEKQIKRAKTFVPFILNGASPRATIKDLDGNILYRGLSSASLDETKDILLSGKLPSGYDCCVATYSQFSKANMKVDFINKFAKDNILVMDESHNASGSSTSGRILTDIVQKTMGVCFLSATYAKRPDNMPVYAVKTAISDAGLGTTELISALKFGGVALQELLSSQIVGEGQLIRRERSYDNIEVNYFTLDSSISEMFPQFDLKDYHYATVDKVLELFRKIISFHQELAVAIESYSVEEYTYDQVIKWLKSKKAPMSIIDKYASDKNMDALDESEREIWNKLTTENYNQPELLVPNPKANVFGLINQMILAVKAEAVADWAVMRMKQGKKPIIALASTLETALEYFKDQDKIRTDFAMALERRLIKCLEYTSVNIDGDIEKEMIDLDDSKSGVFKYIDYEYVKGAYESLKELINTTETGIYISPIDLIKKRISEAGYKIEEVTGRNYAVKYDKNEKHGSVHRRKIPDTTDVFRMFNENNVDCLIINQAGASGASAHAIPNNKVTIVHYDKDGTAIIPTSLENKNEVKQRVMIILQAELDVNKEVQKRGRVNRTGQVFPPIYDYLFSAIPSEKRLMMMLRRKLKSLDANTSSNQQQSSEMLNVVDFLNEYGDQMVADFLVKNTDLNNILGDLVSISAQENTETGETETSIDYPNDLAYTATSRMSILFTAEQEKIYNEIETNYIEYEKKLKDEGRFNLNLSELNLEAETVEKYPIVVGNPEKKSVFGGAAFVEQVLVNNLKKPYNKFVVSGMIEGVLKGNTKDQYVENIVADIKSRAEWSESYWKDHYGRRRKNEIEQANKQVVKRLNKEQKEKYVHNLIDNINERYDNLLKNTNYIEQAESMINYVKSFSVMKKISYPISEDDAVDGLTIGVIDVSKSKTFNKSDYVLRVVFPNSFVKMDIPMNYESIGKIFGMGISDGSFMFSNWDEETSQYSSDRIVRYIITGNILKAFGEHRELQYGAKLISYSTLDKRVKKGILLDENFSINDMKVSLPIAMVKNMLHKDSLFNQREFAEGSVYIYKRTDDIFKIGRIRERKRKYWFDKDKELSDLMITDWKDDGAYITNEFSINDFEEVITVLGNKYQVSMNMGLRDFKAISSNFDIADREGTEMSNEQVAKEYNDLLDKYRAEETVKIVSEQEYKNMSTTEQEVYDLRNRLSELEAQRFLFDIYNTSKKEKPSMQQGGDVIANCELVVHTEFPFDEGNDILGTISSIESFDDFVQKTYGNSDYLEIGLSEIDTYGKGSKMYHIVDKKHGEFQIIAQVIKSIG